MSNYSFEIEKIDKFINLFAKYIADSDSDIETLENQLDSQYRTILITMLNKKLFIKGCIPTELPIMDKDTPELNALSFISEHLANKLDKTELTSIVKESNRIFCTNLLLNIKKIYPEIDFTAISDSIRDLGIVL